MEWVIYWVTLWSITFSVTDSMKVDGRNDAAACGWGGGLLCLSAKGREPAMSVCPKKKPHRVADWLSTAKLNLFGRIKLIYRRHFPGRVRDLWLLLLSDYIMKHFDWKLIYFFIRHHHHPAIYGMVTLGSLGLGMMSHIPRPLRHRHHHPPSITFHSSLATLWWSTLRWTLGG